MSNRVKELRVENHLTQEKLANKVGVSQQTQSLIENNKVSLTEDLIYRYCDIFEVSSDYLIKRSDNRFTQEDTKNIVEMISLDYNIYKLVNGLNGKQKEGLYCFLRTIIDE